MAKDPCENVGNIRVKATLICTSLLFMTMGIFFIPPSNWTPEDPGNGYVVGQSEESNALRLTVLEYHPYPDDDDPFGFAAYPNGIDWFKGYYETSYYFPTTWIDGVDEFEGASSFLSIYNKYSDSIRSRLLKDQGYTITIDGELGGIQTPELNQDQASVEIGVTMKEGSSPAGLMVRAMLFEDDVYYKGGNGITDQRFVVRKVLVNSPINISRQEPVQIPPVIFNISTDQDRELLGVAVYLQCDGGCDDYDDQEVLQSGTFMYRQSGPTRQSDKCVLLEMWTATWCTACLYSDQAVDELANSFGIPTTIHKEKGDFIYFQPPNIRSMSTIIMISFLFGIVAVPIRRAMKVVKGERTIRSRTKDLTGRKDKMRKTGSKNMEE